MRFVDVKSYYDISSVRFSSADDSPQRLQIAWCYPKDLIKLLGYDKRFKEFEEIAKREGLFSYPLSEYMANLEKYKSQRAFYEKFYNYRKHKKEDYDG